MVENRISEGETYKLKGNATSLYTANGNVEEHAGALWLLLAFVSRRRQSCSLGKLTSFSHDRTITGVLYSRCIKVKS